MIFSETQILGIAVYIFTTTYTNISEYNFINNFHCYVHFVYHIWQTIRLLLLHGFCNILTHAVCQSWGTQKSYLWLHTFQDTPCSVWPADSRAAGNYWSGKWRGQEHGTWTVWSFCSVGTPFVFHWCCWWVLFVVRFGAFSDRPLFSGRPAWLMLLMDVACCCFKLCWCCF